MTDLGQTIYRPNTTVGKIIRAAEAILQREDDVSAITVRHISELADVSPSAINYHFGGIDNLFDEVAKGIYARLNAERQSLLGLAMSEPMRIDRQLAKVVEALVGPSIRWSMDQNSSYQALINLTALLKTPMSKGPRTIGRARIDSVAPFIDAFCSLCPWFSREEIAFRVHSALGVRSGVTRERSRMEMLMRRETGPASAEQIVAMTVSVIVPMFVDPATYTLSDRQD